MLGLEVSKNPIDERRRSDFLSRVLRVLFFEAERAVLGLVDGRELGVSLSASIVLGAVGDLASYHREAQLKLGEVV